MTRSETFGEDWRQCSDARGLAQTACSNRFLHPLSARLLAKNSSGTSQSCIPNNTVPIFAKKASYIVSSLRFSPFLLLRSLRNRPSSFRRMASPAKKTGEERENTNYDPEEEESETGTPKKGRKEKEKPDPGLTMGTNIQHFLRTFYSDFNTVCLLCLSCCLLLL